MKRKCWRTWWEPMGQLRCSGGRGTCGSGISMRRWQREGTHRRKGAKGTLAAERNANVDRKVRDSAARR